MEWFIWMLFGHFFGDYIFQNSWMAMNKKSDPAIGMIHCSIYTLIVCLFLLMGGIESSAVLILAIFLSHVILDTTDIVDRWCKLYGIRSWDTHIDMDDLDKSATIKDAIFSSFGSFVYIVIDNTLHLFMMFLAVKFI